MSPNDAVPSSVDDTLQFETAVTASAMGADSASRAPSCAECAQPIAGHYYAAGSTVVCPTCRDRVDAVLGRPVGTSGYLRALVFGLGASLAGAALWFAVYKLLELEIGLIAIAVGWMVGRAMQKGARGLGSRRLQVTAALLTYGAVALSYTAIAIDQSHAEAARPVVADSSTTRAGVEGPRTDSSRMHDASAAPAPSVSSPSTALKDSSASSHGGAGTVALGLAVLFALPVIANLSNLPMGLLGLFILFVGIRQAWHMTRRLRVAFEGPFRVGAAGAAEASASD